jgi:hypothetical protein
VNKIRVALPSIILFLVIAFAIGFYWRYSYLMNRQDDKFVNEKFINKKIRGRLSDIVKYKKNKVVLGIDNHEKYDLTYGVLCIDSTFLNNVAEKDSVYKNAGERELHFITKQGNMYTLKVVFCD